MLFKLASTIQRSLVRLRRILHNHLIWDSRQETGEKGLVVAIMQQTDQGNRDVRTAWDVRSVMDSGFRDCFVMDVSLRSSPRWQSFSLTLSSSPVSRSTCALASRRGTVHGEASDAEVPVVGRCGWHWNDVLLASPKNNSAPCLWRSPTNNWFDPSPLDCVAFVCRTSARRSVKLRSNHFRGS